ncbi:hypothetical protein [Psychrobacillus soli]|uniref:Uncharacterized protein n=1 Tax=Psychrobacillus soli TaxID=1543965 RepID=A0A544SU99_9BACI|nr:hypothetical protein [Psychrobacillus soli]TQR08735.1 hypothetical protein FG383_16415 [Psychrobacillus soli]
MDLELVEKVTRMVLEKLGAIQTGSGLTDTEIENWKRNDLLARVQVSRTARLSEARPLSIEEISKWQSLDFLKQAPSFSAKNKDEVIFRKYQ